VAEQFMDVMTSQNFKALDITVAHARLAGLLPGEHPDPFDRMLIAQAQMEGLPLVSREQLFDRFGIRRIW
jgi:PIN domain nuclease of toxin-antitoxin system